MQLASQEEGQTSRAVASFNGGYMNEAYGLDASRSPSVRSLADDSPREPHFQNPLYSERDHSKDEYYCA